MRCLAIFAICVVSPLFGQTASPAAAPPPETDKALRARVQEFYQDFVDSKFRKTDAFVAEDSKDYFFAMEKVAFKSFDGPKSIVYSDNFQKANVVVTVETEIRNPRLGTMRLHPDNISTWKIIDGQWYWYHAKPEFIDTPFGRRQLPKDYDENNPPSLYSAASGNPPKPPGFHMVTPEELAKQIKVSKQNVLLNSLSESEDSVLVTNSLQGAVTVELRCPPMDGLTIKPTKQDLKPGESVTFVIHHTPKNSAPKSTLNAMVHVDPLVQNVPVKIEFAMPRPASLPPAGR